MLQVALADRLPAHTGQVSDVPGWTVAQTAPFAHAAAVGVDSEESDLEEFQIVHGYRRQKK